jgi:hypothetical protein
MIESLTAVAWAFSTVGAIGVDQSWRHFRSPLPIVEVIKANLGKSKDESVSHSAVLVTDIWRFQ